MNCRTSILILFSVVFFVHYALTSEMNSRHKRCIVVQKQSGTHGDSSEGGGGDEEREPEPRDFKPNRRRIPDPLENVRKDVEDIPPNLLKYRILPTKRYPSDWRHYLSRIYKRL